MKKILKLTLAFIVVAMSFVLPVKAKTIYKTQLHGYVTDAGQVVSKVVIDYGENIKLGAVEKDTFTVHATSIIDYGKNKGNNYYDLDRTIEKVEVNQGKVILHLNQSEGATLTWLAEGRNYPGKLQYTVVQNKEITVSAPDGRELDPIDGEYTVGNTVIDEETSKFKSVVGSKGIDYQFYDSGSDKLIVWFHGNGEGDLDDSTGNNVAQMLANRGTVAWVSDKAQAIFKNASVMAFQAPSTWYYAQKDNLLEKAYDEIQEVIKKYKIDPSKVVVSGCSAGGYMTTRMLIKYPSLFKSAIINCPALDVATARGGETPTDEELASLKQSKTGIWLVQGETDSSVKTDECSKRMFKILTDGQELDTKKVEQDLDSDYTTSSTKDNKYLLTLYETVDVAGANKIKVSEDYNLDGVKETVNYSDHWTWIYSLNNNPTNKDGKTIMEWAANYQAKQEAPKPQEDKPQANEVAQPKLLNGAKQTYVKGSNKGIEVRTSAEVKEFIKVLVDGKEISKENYEVRSGSTIVTLKPSYLETLSYGVHTLTVVSTSGSVTTTFEVKAPAKADKKNVKTGDETSFGLYGFTCLGALVGLVYFAIRKFN